ncbi:MAG: methylated-DNA--[protein]-cysteine S-methyltransferase [Pseudomonadota bacterium]
MPHIRFDTPFGPCALAWSEAGLTRVLLAEQDPSKLDERMAKAGCEPADGPVPSFINNAIAGLRSALAGPASPPDPPPLDELPLEALPLDESIITPFHASVYRALRRVPRGTTVTYGDLAKQVGEPGAARAIGVAMGRNPWPVIVPCHRVLAAGGKLGGFSAPGGTRTKERLLALEGIVIGDPVLPGLFDRNDVA